MWSRGMKPIQVRIITAANPDNRQLIVALADAYGEIQRSEHDMTTGHTPIVWPALTFLPPGPGRYLIGARLIRRFGETVEAKEIVEVF